MGWVVEMAKRLKSKKKKKFLVLQIAANLRHMESAKEKEATVVTNSMTLCGNLAMRPV